MSGHDKGLQWANRLYKAFAPSQDELGQGNRNKWGDNVQCVFVPSLLSSLQNNPEFCFVNVGPFPAPVPLDIRINASPRVQLPTGGRAITRWRFRMTVGVGDNAYQWPAVIPGGNTSLFGAPYLPRSVVATSLSIFACRESTILPNQVNGTNENPSLAIWAAPAGGAYGGLPTVFEVDHYPDIAIATGDFSIQPPPLLATHGFIGNANRAFTTVGRVGFVVQVITDPVSGAAAGNQLLPSQRSDTATFQPFVPVPMQAIQYQVRRDPTTAQESFAVFWARCPMPTHPLRPLADGRAPVISSGFGERREHGKMAHHRGADITYRATPSDPPPRVVNGRVVYTAQRTRNYFSPPGRTVHATEDGVVVQAKVKPGIGGDVWLHHEATGRVTRYAHLSRVDVREGQRVREGERLGVWGAGHGTPFVHLHFELLTAGRKNSQEDPAGYLSSTTEGAPTRPSSAVALAAASRGLPWLLLLIGVLASTRS